MNFRKTFRSEKLCCAFSVKGKRYGHRLPGQKRNIFFPKIGGGGEGAEAVCKFSKNSSNLVQVEAPYDQCIYMDGWMYGW